MLLYYRKWLIGLLLIGLSAAQSANAQTLPNGVAAGDVTGSSAVLWTRSTAPGEVLFEVARDATFAEVVASVAAPVVQETVPVKVDIEGLEPGTLYHYRVTDAAGGQAAGRFYTPHANTLAGLRFGVSGDWRGDLAPFPAISNTPARELDLFVALGDTIYADVPSPDFPEPQATTLAEFRAKHNEVYAPRNGVASWSTVRAGTPMLATIDDHEVTNDFAGGAPPSSDMRFDDTGLFINETSLFNVALQAFHEFNPIREEFYGQTSDPRISGKRKLYRYRTYGLDAALFLLDARSFRDEPLEGLALDAGPAEVDAFLEASFDPTRTMLGAPQLDDLMDDLLRSEQAGITWKFILVPEPIQNFGTILASDRFEGYAAERTALLSFIDESRIHNVVFIAADIHGTVVNNVTYRNGPGEPVRALPVFETTTGPVAYAAPFGPTVMEFAREADLGLASELLQALYHVAGPPLQDALIALAGDILLNRLDLDPIGLDRSPVQFSLLYGQWVSAHVYGWTEFDISAQTQQLTVTTYGIDWYSLQELAADPEGIIAREPEIVSQFVVDPDCSPESGLACADALPPAGSTCGLLGAVHFLGLFIGLVGCRRHYTREPFVPGAH